MDLNVDCPNCGELVKVEQERHELVIGEEDTLEGFQPITRINPADYSKACCRHCGFE